MTYHELKETFCDLKQRSPKDNLTAHIIFTEDSFDKKYPLLSRTYRVSSDNKRFWPNKFSRSIFACCLDETDQGVRLDWYMAEEGNKDGWKVENCYILEQMQDAAAISDLTRTEQDDGTVSYSFGSTRIQARESKENGKLRLKPLTGEQVSDGEWAELAIDRIYGYCTLLERHLNRTVGA
ncbi:MAG: hypothetical protein K2O18_15785 [Oscillospiraceae bacterium]|nr:hypothetical protein [Oscillospiraceae bacterium]